jgi:hypothetical protein
VQRLDVGHAGEYAGRQTCPPGRVTGPGAPFGAGAFGAADVAGKAAGLGPVGEGG